MDQTGHTRGPDLTPGRQLNSSGLNVNNMLGCLYEAPPTFEFKPINAQTLKPVRLIIVLAN